MFKYVTGVLLIAIVGVLFVFWQHYLTLNERIVTQQSAIASEMQRNKTLSSTVDQYAMNVISFQDRILENERRTQEAHDASVQARLQMMELQNLFNTHDFRKLVDQKPGLPERRINRGTRRANLVLECASGRPTGCPDSSPPLPVSQ